MQWSRILKRKSADCRCAAPGSWACALMPMHAACNKSEVIASVIISCLSMCCSSVVGVYTDTRARCMQRCSNLKIRSADSPCASCNRVEVKKDNQPTAHVLIQRCGCVYRCQSMLHTTSPQLAGHPRAPAPPSMARPPCWASGCVLCFVCGQEGCCYLQNEQATTV